MPVERGGFRKAVEDFIQTNPVSQWIIERWNLALSRWETVQELQRETETNNPLLAAALPQMLQASGALYIITGKEFFLAPLKRSSKQETVDEMVEKYVEWWRKTMTDVTHSDVFEKVGAAMSEPILATIQGITRDTGEEPEEYIRRIYGVIVGMMLAPGAIATALEATTLGQLEAPSQIVRAIGQVLDYSLVAGATMSPMIESGVVPQMRRAFRARYRPERFSTSELRDLYALGEITPEEMRKEAIEAGWRDGDVNKWIRLAFRTLTEGDVWALYKKGVISFEDVMRRLRAYGYDPKDIPYLFTINAEDEADDAAAVSRSTARAAFRDNLIGEAEFRGFLEDQGLSEREIDLLVAMDNLDKATKLRSLTVSQIRSAWEENILSDPEALHYLGEEGFGDSEKSLLLETWKAEVEPVFRKLNKGTIVGAYVLAVITREQARAKLEAVGLSEEDALLELDLAEARNPDLFGVPEPSPPRVLSPGTLSDLLQSGLITPDDMQSRLEEQGYSESDAELLTLSAVQKAEEEARPLTESLIAAAYVNGVISRARTISELVEIGYTEEDADLYATTVEANNPAVFYPESVQSVRLPTAGALIEALRSDIIDEGAFYARMAELGYSRDASDLYFAMAIRQERKSAKGLTATQIANAYESGFITWGEAMLRLTSLGYNDADAKILLMLNKRDLLDTDEWAALMSGQLGIEDAIAQFFNLGYTEEEIDDAFETLAPAAA